jgi:uncharacterized protein
MTERLEWRFLPLEGAEVRASGEGRTLDGYAAVFGQEAVIWGLFREEVAPGAYRKTIQEHDIRALWNHDSRIVLGRNKANTLRLREDGRGLHTEIDPPDNEWGRPVVDAVQRGDVTGMSIAFRAVKDSWWYPPEDSDELPKRTIKEAKLYEVSPVTFPAFESTSISARSVALVATEEELIAEARELLAEHKPQGEPEGGTELPHHSDPMPDGEPEPGAADCARGHHSAEWRARELALIELMCR